MDLQWSPYFGQVRLNTCACVHIEKVAERSLKFLAAKQTHRSEKELTDS